MIKLFRHFRKSLILETGNNSKYLKYAIGEIFLVVIGILIALQINNWNIDRIDRKNENLILLDLKVEFLENLKDAERILVGNEEIYNAMSEIQKNIAQEHYDQHELDSLMYYVFDWFDYTPKPGASNNLINSGNLNIIQNEDLRKLLTLWSGVDEELDDDEEVAINYSHNVIIPFIAENFPISNLEKFDGSVEYYQRTDGEKFSYSERLPYDVKALLMNKTFQSHIAVKKIHAYHNAMECTTVIDTCELILDLIEEEIK
jgi:hypothetical protein